MESRNGFSDLISRRRDLLLITLLFAASRVLYGVLGLRFDTTTFPQFMQFIDRDLLGSRLLESLWYYHANPPLLNLLAGVGLQGFGAHANDFFAVVFHLVGWVFAYAMFSLTRRLTGSTTAGYVTCAVFVCSPAFVLYENWFMYSFPAAAALPIAGLLLHRYVQTGGSRWLAAFFWVLAILLLLRSAFHIAWLLGVVGMLVVLLPAQRKQVLVAAALPVLVVGAWYGKNAYLFGTFSSSSWFGLGLNNVTTLVATREQLKPLVESGELSKFALISRYFQGNILFSAFPAPNTGIPVLDQVKKSSGEYNFNYLPIVAVSRYYAADGIAVARHFPREYTIGLLIANQLFFSPTSMNIYFTAHNRQATAPVDRVYDPVINGVGTQSKWIGQPHFGFGDRTVIEANASVWLFIVWWVLLGYGYVQARRGLSHKQDAPDRPRGVVLAFIVFTALYIYGVGTAFELGENYRYRWLAEPLTFVLAGTAATHLLRTLRRRFPRRVSTPA